MNYTSTSGDGLHLFVKSGKSLSDFDCKVIDTTLHNFTKHKIWLLGFHKGSSTTFAQTHDA